MLKCGRKLEIKLECPIVLIHRGLSEEGSPQPPCKAAVLAHAKTSFGPNPPEYGEYPRARYMYTFRTRVTSKRSSETERGLVGGLERTRSIIAPITGQLSSLPPDVGTYAELVEAES